MDAKTVWIWALSGVSVLLVSSAIFFITLPPSQRNDALPYRPQLVNETTSPSSPATKPSSTATDALTHTGTAPFVITTMTHMEGNFKDDVDQNLFTKHVSDMRWAMELFDEYGAKLTFESEQSFAKANINWDVNILQEVIDNGHGVGTHGDFGAAKTTTIESLTADFIENKGLIDGLVGAENNQGVSGGTGPADWILGAAAAGFSYYDAVTGFGYLSMPLDARPDGWTNSYIAQTAYHDPIPPNLRDRMYPIPLKDAKDFVADSEPVIVVMGGDIGELSSLAEGRSTCTPDCALDASDITVITNSIDQILAERDTSRFAKINFHIPLNLLQEKNETLLRSMLYEIKAYTDTESLSWDTQLGAYEQYVRWGK